MAKTWEGWSFCCKQCYRIHLIPCSLLSQDVLEQKKLRLPCLSNPKTYHNYERKDFEHWTGSRETYVSNRVVPSGFIERDPNFPE